jgi:hypothetical protein
MANEDHKFYIAAWKFSFYMILSSVGLRILLTSTWTWTPIEYFKDCPHYMSPFMKIYYNLQISGYIYSIIMMPFEPKQKLVDQVAYLVHHFTTIGLLGFS